ncbi:hypothetical protein F511_08820 [Dorcoceras hygrometricum]|uniref:Uncharacterized protein n=1 Tax=Dorcoceras hygrometricum TaxID=472368 RepID=A0A2Z7AIZ5_9LAMI|nr:hypothetical protein F511_08820 [Dorcoceras hygrometricum]
MNPGYISCSTINNTQLLPRQLTKRQIKSQWVSTTQTYSTTTGQIALKQPAQDALSSLRQPKLELLPADGRFACESWCQLVNCYGVVLISWNGVVLEHFRAIVCVVVAAEFSERKEVSAGRSLLFSRLIVGVQQTLDLGDFISKCRSTLSIILNQPFLIFFSKPSSSYC